LWRLIRGLVIYVCLVTIAVLLLRGEMGWLEVLLAQALAIAGAVYLTRTRGAAKSGLPDL
jgi:hypothetical protein